MTRLNGYSKKELEKHSRERIRELEVCNNVLNKDISSIVEEFATESIMRKKGTFNREKLNNKSHFSGYNKYILDFSDNKDKRIITFETLTKNNMVEPYVLKIEYDLGNTLSFYSNQENLPEDESLSLKRLALKIPDMDTIIHYFANSLIRGGFYSVSLPFKDGALLIDHNMKTLILKDLKEKVGRL